MNNTRRKALQKIYAAIEEVKSDLENIYDEEQTYGIVSRRIRENVPTYVWTF